MSSIMIPPKPAPAGPIEIPRPDLQEQLLAGIHNTNSTDTADVLDRLARRDKIVAHGVRLGMRTPVVIDWLWTASYCHDVLAIEVGGADRYGYLRGDDVMLRAFSSLLGEQLVGLYAKLSGRSAGPERILERFPDGPERAGYTGSRGLAFEQAFRAFARVQRCRAAFKASPELLVRATRDQRKEIGWGLLARREQGHGGEAVTLEEDTFVADAPLETTPAPSPGPATVARRAVDMPDWQKFSSRYGEGVPWEVVLRQFGPQMMVRIILRRQDYRPLLQLLQNSPRGTLDEKYIYTCLMKIDENQDVRPERREAFDRLIIHLRGIGADH